MANIKVSIRLAFDFGLLALALVRVVASGSSRLEIM
jgi:hypothetical protein